MAEQEQDQAIDTSEVTPERPKQTVTIEDLGPARKKLTIELPAERIAEALEMSFSKLRSDAAVPGFRRGRVPQRLLEKRFGQSLRDDLRGQLISESYHQALEDHELRVLGEPDVKNIDEIKLPDDGPMTFEVEVEVAPEVQLPSLEGVPVQKKPVTVSDEDVDKELKLYQDRFGTMIAAPDGVVAADDYVSAEVKVNTADGTEILHQEQANIYVTGEEREFKGHVVGIIVDDLGKQMAGKKVGDEVTLTLVGPASHENEQIRDKPITIQITVKEIQRVEPAPVQTLVTQFGEESEDSLKSRIRENLQERAEREQQSRLHEQIRDYLLEKTDLDLPPGITGRQAERLLYRETMELAYRGVPSEEIAQQVAEMRSRSEEEARKQLKAFFVLEAAAEQLNVEVAENELNGRIAMMAMQQGRRPEKLRQDMHRNGELEYLYIQMREQKTLDAILAKANVTEVAADADTGEAAAPKKTTRKKSKKD